jgi:hypothetical protein
VPQDLCPEEIRVLGALAEKDLATPEYYPLSLNALENACNQKSNREPVVAYDDDTVRTVLESLQRRGLAARVSEAGSRVEKFRHRLPEAFNFTRGETALLAVLMLRGPQTAAELRERTGRMYPFDSVEAVTHALDRLAAREPEPLTRLLPRQPGSREPRWAHLFSGEAAVPIEAPAAESAQARPDRLSRLEEEVAALRAELDDLRRRLEPLL